MKINKLIEKYFFFQFVYILPFGLIFHLVILDNFSMIEAITYSFVLSGISTYYLYNRINKILNYKQNINNFETEEIISKKDIKELGKQLVINKFWSDTIIHNADNQLLIVSNVSILAYQELILIDYYESNDSEYIYGIIIDKSKSSLATSKKESFKKEIISKL